MATQIPVIDLFAGPGGLGEGFSSLLDQARERKFKIKLSIEKDEIAHRTLELRAFFRQFSAKEVPQDYYNYVAGKINIDELYERHPKEAERAWAEAWHATLGKTRDSEVDERIVLALGTRRQNWVLIGGPPCQAYSLVGRSRVIGGEGIEKYENDEKHTLYQHYLRILAIHQPPVFVMENVKGLLSAKVKEEQIFKKILADLKNPPGALPEARGVDPVRYNLYSLSTDRTDLLKEVEPEDFVLCAEDYGIPQARHRIIILGVRTNIQDRPSTLAKANPFTVKQAIDDLPILRSGLSKNEDSAESWRQAIFDITKAAWLRGHEIERDIVKAAHQIKRNLTRGGGFILGGVAPRIHVNWFQDRRLNGVCNHETRGHISKDLHRYLFAAVFAQVKGRSPLLEDFPESLLPEHQNVADALKETKFNDRFRVQIADRPSTTVVSHISKDGHYYIHYDPTQCRSLTVREAARLQTFPDNYFFEGPRTQQYQQVGNAVPPLLAQQIAEVVSELF